MNELSPESAAQSWNLPREHPGFLQANLSNVSIDFNQNKNQGLPYGPQFTSCLTLFIALTCGSRSFPPVPQGLALATPLPTMSLQPQTLHGSCPSALRSPLKSTFSGAFSNSWVFKFLSVIVMPYSGKTDRQYSLTVFKEPG